MADQVVLSNGKLMTEQGRHIAADALTGTVDVTFDDVTVDDFTAADLVVSGTVTLGDAVDVTINATTGTKIGQSGSKLAFFGATPIVKPSALVQTHSTADATLGALTAAAPAAVTAANPAAITAAAPAALTAADLTDNSGGTSGGTTIAVVTDNASAANAIATLAAMVDKLTVDLAASRAEVVKLVTDLTASRAEVVKLVTDITASQAEVVKLVADHADLAAFVNSAVDKLQALGLVA